MFQTEVFDVYFLGGAVCECGRLHLGSQGTKCLSFRLCQKQAIIVEKKIDDVHEMPKHLLICVLSFYLL